MCVKRKTSYTKLLCCVLSLFLLLVIGCIPASAESILSENLIDVSPAELSVYVDGNDVWMSLVEQGYKQNTIYPSAGNIAYKVFSPTMGTNVKMDFYTHGEFVIPAESKVYLRFLVIGLYWAWDNSIMYTARMYDTSWRDVLYVDHTGAGSDGCTMSKPTSLGDNLEGVLVTFYYDNSLNSSDVILTDFQFEWLYSSSAHPIYVGSSGCLIQTVGDSPADAPVYPDYSDNNEQLDDLENKENEVMDKIQAGLDSADQFGANTLNALNSYIGAFQVITQLTNEVVMHVPIIGILLHISAFVGLFAFLLGMFGMIFNSISSDHRAAKAEEHKRAFYEKAYRDAGGTRAARAAAKARTDAQRPQRGKHYD